MSSKFRQAACWLAKSAFAASACSALLTSPANAQVDALIDVICPITSQTVDFNNCNIDGTPNQIWSGIIGDKLFNNFIASDGVAAGTSAFPDGQLEISTSEFPPPGFGGDLFDANVTFDTAFSSTDPALFDFDVSILPAYPDIFFALAQIDSTVNLGASGTTEYQVLIPDLDIAPPILKSTNGNSTGNVPFSPGVTSTNVLGTFVTSGSASIDSVSVNLIQAERTESVPGPLPLFGAGAAFCYSRKLRKRIKQVA